MGRLILEFLSDQGEKNKPYLPQDQEPFKAGGIGGSQRCSQSN